MAKQMTSGRAYQTRSKCKNTKLLVTHQSGIKQPGNSSSNNDNKKKNFFFCTAIDRLSGRLGDQRKSLPWHRQQNNLNNDSNNSNNHSDITIVEGDDDKCSIKAMEMKSTVKIVCKYVNDCSVLSADRQAQQMATLKLKKVVYKRCKLKVVLERVLLVVYWKSRLLCKCISLRNISIVRMECVLF